jgi:molybdopterin synthase sulfur carrier subunit
MTVKILYFAVLKDQAGLSQESVETGASDVAGLYAETAAQHGFDLPVTMVRFSMNGQFVNPDEPLTQGCEVVFVPPTAGG